MTATTPAPALATHSVGLALAGFLAGYRGLTREAYTLDPHQFAGRGRARSLPLFQARRAAIETLPGN